MCSQPALAQAPVHRAGSWGQCPGLSLRCRPEKRQEQSSLFPCPPTLGAMGVPDATGPGPQTCTLLCGSLPPTGLLCRLSPQSPLWGGASWAPGQHPRRRPASQQRTLSKPEPGSVSGERGRKEGGREGGGRPHPGPECWAPSVHTPELALGPVAQLGPGPFSAPRTRRPPVSGRALPEVARGFLLTGTERKLRPRPGEPWGCLCPHGPHFSRGPSAALLWVTPPPEAPGAAAAGLSAGGKSPTSEHRVRGTGTAGTREAWHRSRRPDAVLRRPLINSGLRLRPGRAPARVTSHGWARSTPPAAATSGCEEERGKDAASGEN